MADWNLRWVSLKIGLGRPISQGGSEKGTWAILVLVRLVCGRWVGWKEGRRKKPRVRITKVVRWLLI